MTFVPPKRNSGIALIIVMIVVTALAAMAAIFANAMKVETTLARRSGNDSEMEWMGRSGAELAKYVIAASATGPAMQFDSLMHKWAGGPGDSNDPLSAIDLENFELGRGVISIKIEDNDRKFNINMADEIVLRQAVTLIGVDASLSGGIIDSILDWRDPDDQTHTSGTESEYYERLPMPYFAKDGPLDDISELLYIKGITTGMYFGANAGAAVPMKRSASARDSNFDEPSYSVGFKDLFTTMSSRLLNPNTASAIQLQVIPEIDEAVASAIVSARAGPDGADGTIDDMPFRNLNDLQMRVPGFNNPMIVQTVGRYFTFRSGVFTANIEVRIDTQRRTYVATLRRNGPKDTQLLTFYWK